MQASAQSLLKPVLSSLLMALVLITPTTWAKKDLFGSDPASEKSAPAQQLITAPESPTGSVVEHELPNEELAVAAPEEKNSPSFLEKQFQRLKSNISSAKKDLFGKDSSDKKSSTKTQSLIDAPSQSSVASSNAATSAPAEVVPLISTTEAAQRAQRYAEGQVINVRKFQEEEKTLYGVKLLQKNGRMKTVNIDANTGVVIEDAPLETQQ